MPKGFPGFPKELFTFLRDLTKNNNREWFKENKDRYRQTVVTPVCDFIEHFGYKLEKISECFIADSRPHGGSMFRIYRDIRFAKDKRPYKEHVGCHFKHEAGKDAHAPGFYLHLEAEKVVFGGGIWMPPSSTLDQVRQRIINKPDQWQKITKNKKILSYGGIKGDGLKRPPRGYDANHPHIEDLKRKSFFIMNEVDKKLALQPEFIKEVDRTFKGISPMIQFVTQALGLPYQRT